MASTPREDATPAEAMLALRALLSDRAFKRSFAIGIGFREGDRAVLEVSDQGVALKRWHRETDISILTNVATLWDLMLGRFDPRAPEPRHLFLWAGEPEVMFALAEGLGSASSWLELRASTADESRRPKRRKKR